MKMKRVICVLFALILMVGVVGCGRKDDNNNSGALGQDEISLGGAEAGNSMDETDLKDDEIEVVGSGAEFGDENVLIDVQLGKEGYTLQEIVDVKVTITNIAETPIVYVQGSGSNRVPDALQITLDRLSPMFMPFQMTMDYQTQTLEPGESVTYEAPFAPYAALADDTVIGLDRDIDFFRTDDFEPVGYGAYEGAISFRYAISDEAEVGAAIDLIDDAMIVIEGRFRTDIVEDGDGGTALHMDNDGEYSADENGRLDDEDRELELDNDITE